MMINAFLNVNPDFNLITAGLFNPDMLAQYNWPEDVGQKELLQALRTRQRLLKIYPDDAVAATLESLGFHSAHHIASVGASAFAQKVMPELSMLTHVQYPKAFCAKLFGNAERIRRTSFELALATPRNADAALKESSGEDSHPDFQKGIPDYQRLFGPMITCDCEECQSIFGPAAYFTDLMRIVTQYVMPPLESLFALQYRRPDLWTIPLNCITAETEVSYLDIVNGVLCQNLKANYTGGADPLQEIASQVYPFTAPFNQSLLKVRAGMEAVETPLAGLYKLLEVTPSATAAGMLNLSPEQLSLITGSHAVSLAQLYGFHDSGISDTELCDALSVQKTFLHQTGLRPDQLEAMIYQDLKKVNGSYVMQDKGSQDIHTAEFSDAALTGPLTIECWIYPTAIHSPMSVMGKGTGEEFYITLNNANNNQIYCQCEYKTADNTLVHFGSNAILNLNVWTHIAWTRDVDTGTNKLYINGFMDRTYKATEGSAKAGNSSIGIGYITGSSFQGGITELRLWSAVRTASQIQAMMHFRLKNYAETDLFAYWPLNDPADTTEIANDYGPHSYDASGTYKTAFYESVPIGGASEEIPAIMHGLFLNNLLPSGQYITLSGADYEAKTAAKIRIGDGAAWTSLSDNALSPIAVYIRLQAQTGWAFEELDWLLKTIAYNLNIPAPQTINDAIIESLGQVAELVKKYKIRIDELSSFWYDMKTYGRGNEAIPKDLWDRIFNSPPLMSDSTNQQQADYYRPQYTLNPLFSSPVLLWTFKNSTVSQDQRLGNQLTAALGISAQDLSAIIHSTTGASATSLTLSVSRLSQFYRIARFAQMLNMSVPDFIQLGSIAGIALTATKLTWTITEVISLCEKAEWMKRSRLTIDQLTYLTSSAAPGVSLRLSDASTVNKALTDMRQSSAQALITPARFISERINSATAQAIYDRLLSAQVIDNNGVVLMNESVLSPEWINEVLRSDTETANQIFPAGDERNCVCFSSSGSGKASFSFDPFANETIQATNCFTISAWVKPDIINSNGWQKIIGHDGGGNTNTLISPTLRQVEHAAGDLQVCMSLENDFYESKISNYFVDPNKWVYVSWVNDHGDWKVYRNGVLVPFASPMDTVPGVFRQTGSSPAYVFANGFNGSLFNVSIWTTPRSATEIQLDMTRSDDSHDPDLLAFWPLDEGDGKSISNRAGNSEAVNGTLSGSYVWSSTAELAARLECLWITRILSDAFAAQNLLVVKTLAPIAGVSPDTMAGICMLTSGEVDNSSIFTTPPYSPYPFSANMLLRSDPDSGSADVHNTFLSVLQRNAAMTRWLKLTGQEAAGITSYSQLVGNEPISYSTRCWTLDQLMTLSDYKSLQSLCNETNGLLDYFRQANDTGTNKPSDSQLTLLSQLTGWNLAELNLIVSQSYFSAVNFNTVAGLRKLANVVSIELKTGTGIATLNQLRGLSELNLFAGTNDQYWQHYTDTATATTAMLNGKSGATAIKALNATLAEQVREALCDWLIRKLQTEISGVKNQQDLYEYLLIDVNMSPDVKTSWMVAGMNSLQLYVNRIINNLEPGVINNIPETWWEWMSTYRVWQANREVYLYPENYVDPSLRKFQSPAFRTFISDVSKGQITDENVKQALAGYLESVNEVASLKLIDGYVDSFSLTPADEPERNGKRSIHLIGRSRKKPSVFYSRTAIAVTSTAALDRGASTDEATYMHFGPWQEINLQINSDYVSTVMAFGRQFIFWVEQTEITNTDSNSSKYTSIYATVYYSYRDFSGKWNPPVTFMKDKLIDIFGPAIDHQINYYEAYFGGARLGNSQTDDKFYKARNWKEVKLQVLPPTESEDEMILVTIGALVSCPSSMETDPARTDTTKMIPAAADYQDKLYTAAKRAYKRKGEITTIIAAHTLSSAMEVRTWKLSIDSSAASFIDYGTLLLDDKPGLVFFADTPGNDAEIDNVYRASDAFWPMLMNMQLVTGTTIKSLYTNTPGTFSATPTALGIEDPLYNALEPVFFNASLFATIPWDKYQGLAEFTVSCWVYFSHQYSELNDQNLLSLIFPLNNTASRCGWDISVKDRKFRFGIGVQNGISTQIVQGTAEDKKWYFLALTVYPGKNIVATVNESSSAAYAIPYSPIPSSSSQQLTIGKNNGYNNTHSQLFGSIANLKLWKSPLSQEELLNEYYTRGMQPRDEEMRRLGNSAAGFLYNMQKQSYLVLPDFEAALLAETLLPTYTQSSQNLKISFSRSPVADGTAVKMRLIRVNTDTLPVMIHTLARRGVSELLRPAMQYLPEEKPPFVPGTNVLLPETDVMSFSGAFGTYFWEIFFYAPYYIAEKLRSANKYPEAEKWYQYIFDPTNQATPIAYWPLNRMLNDQFPDLAGGEAAIPNNLTSSSEETLPFSNRQRDVWTFTPGPENPSTLSVSDSKALNSPEFTVGAWINLKSVPKYPNRYSVVCSQSAYAGFSLVINDAGKGIWFLTLSIGTSKEWGHVESRAQADINEWVYVAGTYDGKHLQVFINGDSVTKPVICEQYAFSTQRLLSIGSGTSQSVGGNYFDGSIAEVILFDHALSQGELKQIYQNYSQLSLNSNFWNFRPFRRINIQSLYHILNGDAWEESFFQPAQYYSASLQMAVYEYDPFDPDTLARLRINSWQKATFMRYIDNLISWGDSLFTQDTWETLSDATMRYTLANTLLGRMPVKSVTESSQPSVNYHSIELEYGTADVPPFLIEMENQLSALGADATLPAQVLSIVDAYFCIPANKQLIKYWELVADRLYKLRHGLSISGAPNVIPLYAPPVEPGGLVAAAAATGNIPGIAASATVPAVPWYRFSYMIGQARSVTSEVVRLGTELLAALEKKDAERLSQLQAGYQIVLNNLAAQIKASQINQLQYLGEGLQANLDNAIYVSDTYKKWLRYPINAEEASALILLGGALLEHGIGMGVKMVSVFSYLFPTIFGLADGGFHPGESLNATAGVADAAGQLLSMESQLVSQMAQFTRRQEEWQMQLNVSSSQIREIQAQITANGFALQAAQQEMAMTGTQFKQSQEVYNFLKTKFTNEELYDWMSGQLSTLYYQMFQLAWSLAQSSQTALQYELNLNQAYLNRSAWNASYQGLLAGDALSLALQQMENAFISNNKRKLEIRKTWSMRQNNPLALLTLVSTGNCRFDLNELSYDLDFPGHYNRKIKSLSITIPAVVGPYQNIHATLIQTGNKVVAKSNIAAVEYLLGISNAAPSDGSLRINWNPNQEIIISTGINDTGAFQVNFNDEQYLPFEGTGAVSSWSLSIPQASNAFPLRSISDVIVTVEYTAEDGGSTYTSQVTALAPLTEYKGWQYLSMRQLYSMAWFDFCDNPVDNASSLPFELLEQMYPANLEKDSIRLGTDDGKIALVPAMQQGYTGELPEFSMNDSITFWSAEKGMPVYADNENPQPVPGKGNPWTLHAENIPDNLIINGKIDQTKLLDVMLVIPFSGKLNW